MQPQRRLFARLLLPDYAALLERGRPPLVQGAEVALDPQHPTRRDERSGEEPKVVVRHPEVRNCAGGTEHAQDGRGDLDPADGDDVVVKGVHAIPSGAGNTPPPARPEGDTCAKRYQAPCLNRTIRPSSDSLLVPSGVVARPASFGEGAKTTSGVFTVVRGRPPAPATRRRAGGRSAFLPAGADRG